MTLSRPAAILPGSTPDKNPLVKCEACGQMASQMSGVTTKARFRCARCIAKRFNRTGLGRQWERQPRDLFGRFEGQS